MEPNNQKPPPSPLSQQETDALNRHGVFFKKRILQALKAIPEVEVVAEELGVSFGETRVIDIVAEEKRWKPSLLFVFECKRAYAADRKWFFFQDLHKDFRLCRKQLLTGGNSSDFSTHWFQNEPAVCSEGYEFQKNNSKADQDPIFKAAEQLSAGYLGFMAGRERCLHPARDPRSDIEERYVPVLVTTAELVVVDDDLSATSLETGNISTPPPGTPTNVLVLKHPFPTPEGMNRDVRVTQRSSPTAEDWSQLRQLHKESIFVVHAPALVGFVTSGYRDYLRDAGYPSSPHY